MVRTRRIVRVYAVEIPREISSSFRARRWLLPLAVLAVTAAGCYASNAPVIQNFRCPVDGSHYFDDYGPRDDGSFHYGIDMLAPTGTPTWAVKDGTLRYNFEDLGGLVAYLYAKDGNVYYYAHMSEQIGGDRPVVQGDPIGRVGQTGNATAPHLYFDMRIGDVNGNRPDPYPTLQNAGC
jgi:murein DD-endopeptidase MepM/ murein hydrolase activator NlpD